MFIMSVAKYIGMWALSSGEVQRGASAKSQLHGHGLKFSQEDEIFYVKWILICIRTKGDNDWFYWIYILVEFKPAFKFDFYES